MAGLGTWPYKKRRAVKSYLSRGKPVMQAGCQKDERSRHAAPIGVRGISGERFLATGEDWLGGTVGPARRGRLRLRTLILIRWVALAGQAITLAVVHYGLGFALPIQLCMTVVAASAMVNTAMALRRPAQAWVGDRDGALYLGFDIGQLALLLFLTGGLQNPFALLILAPLTLAAAALSRRTTIGLCALALLAISVLAVWHLPLPWAEPGLSLPTTYLVGLFVSIVVAVSLISLYTWHVAHSARRMADALAATQLALAREQRLSAVGALAAAAAHELGSPLATIAVVARELDRELPADSPQREDAALLLSQSDRCARILAGLLHQPEADGGAPYERLAVSALVEAAAAPYLRENPAVAFAFDKRALDRSPEPEVGRAPEVLQGLGAIIQNAAQFAAHRVEILTEWDQGGVQVTVADDGSGFDPTILGQLGEPYLSSRAGGGHMGLGVFIACTLLERTGASLGFENRPGIGPGGRVAAAAGGAAVAIRWNRGTIGVGRNGR
jgi:two-component system sensor histidine kinase RegB